MQSGGVGSTIVSCNADRDGVWIVFIFGILRALQLARVKLIMGSRTYLDKDIPISILVKDIGVHEFVLLNIPSTSDALPDKLLVGVRLLRVLVQVLHVRMRRRRIQIPVQLLAVLSMVSLMSRNTEQTFLQNRINSIPQPKCEAKALVVIRNSGKTVFAPSVSP